MIGWIDGKELVSEDILNERIDDHELLSSLLLLLLLLLLMMIDYDAQWYNSLRDFGLSLSRLQSV